MAKDINLKSQEWNDIIFEGKNKNYGAYEMRQSSSKRHIIAFLICIAIVLFVAFLPLIIKSVAELRKGSGENISTSNVMTDLTEVDKDVEEKNKIIEDNTPPEPPLKSTIIFIPPTIAEASEINDDNDMRSMDELATDKRQISWGTVDGVDDENAIDIEDLLKHQAMADEKAEEILDGVEQMPEYPGGYEALTKYLNQSIEYPAIARENNIQGRVFIKFVVYKDGTVGKIEVAQGVHSSLDKEAVRVVKEMPKWIAGRQNGKTVNVAFTLPIIFSLK